MSNVKQMLNTLKGDPTAILQRANNTPQMREAQRLIQEAGGDPRKAFYDLASKRGVDPNEILSMLK